MSQGFKIMTCPRCGGTLFEEKEGKTHILTCLLCARSFDFNRKEIKPRVGMVKLGRPDIR